MIPFNKGETVKKYNEYKNPNYAQIGTDMLSFWKEQGIFRKVCDPKRRQPYFYLL